jgi:hypothetical protein
MATENDFLLLPLEGYESRIETDHKGIEKIIIESTGTRHVTHSILKKMRDEKGEVWYEIFSSNDHYLDEHFLSAMHSIQIDGRFPLELVIETLTKLAKSLV